MCKTTPTSPESNDGGIQQLETDYLVIGAGVTGMAFVDELLHRTRAADGTSFVLVDKLAHPGGHWNHAYSFVNLHQGSYFYGVNSEYLERERGKLDLSTKCEILAYYEKVMRKMLSTGRVVFLSQCEYTGDGNVRSLVSKDKKYEITTREKIVDARYTELRVPLTHSRNFTSSAAVNLVPTNGLSALSEPYDEYVIIGNGKTGVDAVLYLLDQGVDESRIRWIISRDVWFYNRNVFGIEEIVDFEISVFRAMANEDDTTRIVKQLHKEEVLMKFDDVDDPPVFRCASVTKEELARVQKVGDIIRSGWVKHIGEDEIEFVNGESVRTSTGALHVDCTACGLPRRDAVPIFKDERNIILQSIIPCSPAWSAAIIAMLEAKENDDGVRNGMATPAPHPETPDEWITAFLIMMKNASALKPHDGDVDAMRLNPLTAGRFLPRVWKLVTKLVPLQSKILEKVAERGI